MGCCIMNRPQAWLLGLGSCESEGTPHRTHIPGRPAHPTATTRACAQTPWELLLRACAPRRHLLQPGLLVRAVDRASVPPVERLHAPARVEHALLEDVGREAHAIYGALVILLGVGITAIGTPSGAATDFSVEDMEYLFSQAPGLSLVLLMFFAICGMVVSVLWFEKAHPLTGLAQAKRELRRNSVRLRSSPTFRAQPRWRRRQRSSSGEMRSAT
eukprot:5945710-Prymnesium_polylepis.2